MKIYLFIILFVGIQLKIIAQKGPIFSAKDTIDYGNIISDEDWGKRTLLFTNIGNAPLMITSVKSSCGCLVPVYWPKQPVDPGKTDSVVITYDLTRIGRINKTITVTANEVEGQDANGNNIYKMHIIRVLGEVKNRE